MIITSYKAFDKVIFLELLICDTEYKTAIALIDIQYFRLLDGSYTQKYLTLEKKWVGMIFVTNHNYRINTDTSTVLSSMDSVNTTKQIFPNLNCQSYLRSQQFCQSIYR